MYIYSSHMGGLYTNEGLLSYDQLYCDQCGDSDTYLGSADTLDEAWDLVKPYDLACLHCIKEGDACDECTDAEWSLDHGYSFGYVMNFLASNFPIENGVYVVMVGKKDDRYMVNCVPAGFEFGEKHLLPRMFCYKEEYTDHAVEALKGKFEHAVNVNFLTKLDRDKDVFIIYTCDAENEEEGAHWEEDGWWGMVEKSYIKPMECDEEIWAALQK